MTTHTPKPCSHAAMARRASSEIVLLNTGNYPAVSNYLNTTWKWTPSDWTAVSSTDIDTSGPLPLRTDFSMAYDGTRVVLYGGRGASELDGTLQDTWYWDGTAWSKQTPATIPFGRFGHKMVFQSFGTAGAIMFGGSNVLNYLQETWQFTSGNWTKLSTAHTPSVRIKHAMAASASIVLLFGGQNSNSCLNDVYSFDGSDWTAISATGAPSVRSDAVMAYDTANSKFVLFGGENESTFITPSDCTYTSTNGSSWTKEAPTTIPSSRIGMQMAYDGTNVIMFGGVGNTLANSETWKWDGSLKNWVLL